MVMVLFMFRNSRGPLRIMYSPCDSRENGVFLCDDLSEVVASVNVSDILNNCICFPLPCNNFLVLLLFVIKGISLSWKHVFISLHVLHTSY